MMKRVVILSFDSFGGLTLRQPLFTALLEAGDQVTIAVRQGYDRLLPFLDPRLGVVTTEMDPYRPSNANTPGNAEALRLHIARLQPQLLVCVPYNRTSLDEWLLGQFPDVERIGLRNPSLALARCDPPSVKPDRFLPPVGVEALFTHSVACAEGDHEVEKNRALCKATGEIMAYLNSDDILLPGALNYVAVFFATHPDIDVVYGHRVLIDEQNGEIGRWVLPPHDDQILHWADYVPQETLFWRRRMWEKAGGYVDESYQFALDWELLLRFQQAGAKFQRLPRFLGAFRVHATQKTSNQLGTVGQQEMARLRERCHGRPVSHIEIGRGIRPYLARSVVYHTLYRLGVCCGINMT